jgi:hypothetical protein
VTRTDPQSWLQSQHGHESQQTRLFPGGLDGQEEQQVVGETPVTSQQQQQPLTGFFTTGVGKLMNTLDDVLGKKGKAGPGMRETQAVQAMAEGGAWYWRRQTAPASRSLPWSPPMLWTTCLSPTTRPCSALAEDPSAAGGGQQQAEKGACLAPDLFAD